MSDPNAALRNVTNALQTNDLDDDALASFDTYVEWTGNGGFMADDDVRAEFTLARCGWERSNGVGAFQDAYRDYLNDGENRGAA